MLLAVFEPDVDEVVVTGVLVDVTLDTTVPLTAATLLGVSMYEFMVIGVGLASSHLRG